MPLKKRTLNILKILERHLWMHQTYDMIFLSSEDLFEYQLSKEKKIFLLMSAEAL